METKASPTSVVGRAKASSSAGKVSGVEIDLASNGFTVMVRRKSEPTKNEPYPYREPERMVFNDIEAALDCIRKALGGGGKKEK